MKKTIATIFTALLFLTAPFGPSADAATLVSVTAKRTDNSANSKTVTGTGKYMKFTCEYSGSTSNDNADALCEVRRGSSEIKRFYVGGKKGKSQSTDVWLDKGVSYTLYVNVEQQAPSNGSVTGTLKDR